MVFKKNMLFGYALAFLYAMLNLIGQSIVKNDLRMIPSTLPLLLRVIVIFTFTSIIIIIYNTQQKLNLFKTDHLGLQLIRGITFSVVSFFRYQSIQYIPLVIYTAIALSERVIIVIISMIIGEEREYKSLISIILLNIISIFIVQFGPAWLDIHFDNQQYYIGILFALIANILCALSGYITSSIHKYSADSSLTTALYTTGIAALILPMLAFFDNKSYEFLQQNIIIEIFAAYKYYIIALCILGICTQYLSIYMFKHINPNTQSSISSSSVVVAAIMGEKIQSIVYIGVAGMVISMLLIFRRDYLKKQDKLSTRSIITIISISCISIILILLLSYRLYDPSASGPYKHIGCGCC